MPGYEQQPEQVSFATTEVGWLAVTASPPNGKDKIVTTLLGTVDGGNSWQEEWRGTGVASELVAVNASHAVLTLQGFWGCSAGTDGPGCNTTLLETDNGGRRWAPISRSRRVVTSVAFANGLWGLAAIVPHPCSDNIPPPPKPPPTCEGAVARTTDGGRHWSGVLKVPGPVIAVDATGQTWWAVQDVRGTGSRDGLVFWASSDDGSRWSKRGRAAGPSFLSVRAQANLVVGQRGQMWLSLFDLDSCSMNGCATVQAWHSENDGRSWAEDTPRVAAPPGVGQLCGPSALSLSADRQRRPYLALDYGAGCASPEAQVFSWSNGQWRLVSAQRGSGFFSAMAWPTPEVAYAVANQAVARTLDGGRHWAQAWPALSPTGPLAPLGSKVVIAARDLTSPDVVLGSSDGGAQWSVLSALPGEVLYVDFPSPAQGFAAVCNDVTGSVTLDLSRDKGRTWSAVARLPFVERGNLSGVWFSATGRGLALITRGESPVHHRRGRPRRALGDH